MRTDQDDTIKLVEQGEHELSVRDAMLALLDNPRRNEVAKKALAIKALSSAWRSDLERRLKN